MTSPSGDYTATLPRKRMGSAVLLRDHDGRILLVEPAYKDHWELPGGAVDADEIHLPAEELSGWAWSSLAEAQQRLSPLLCRRAAAALEAVAGGVPAYLENGIRVV